MSDRGRSATPSGSPGPGAYRPSSQASSPGQRGGSPTKSAAGRPGWVTPLGTDPARLESRDEGRNTRMELPPDAYVTESGRDLFALRGNKFNTEGRSELIEVNQLRMTKFNPNIKIYQYDVALSPDTLKRRPIMKKICEHPKFKAAMAPYNFPMWIFDGAKLAWSSSLLDRGEIRVMVDLDEGRPAGRPARKEGSNKFLVIIRKTTEVKMGTLQGYLERSVQFNSNVQEALNFMDHLIRQQPSQRMLAIKRNFYKPSDKGRPLMDGGIVEVHKGTYASIRLSHNMQFGGQGLALNVDIANTCFWIGRRSMDELMVHFLATQDPRRWRGLTPITVASHLRPVQGTATRAWQSSDAFKQLRKLRKLRFTIQHPGRTNPDKVYTVMDIFFDEKYGAEGANAKNVTFEHEGRVVSVADYFREKYKVHLRHANLPLIETGKGGRIPMELAFMESMQRYPFKLNPEQTAAMIKIAVTRPPQRKGDIMKNVADLQLSQDPLLKHYGIGFDTQLAKTEARILPPPPVNFGQGTADPKFSGRWDLRGKKFFKQNVAPLMNWAFIVMNDCVAYPELQQFARAFKTTFLGHGGKCTADPLLLNVPGNIKDNAAQALAWAHNEVTKQRGYTQLIFVVVQHKNSPHYERLKKSADCRFGILTQVVNGAAVQNNNGQYHSNVCMKVNAKLGGSTSRTQPPWKSQPSYFPKERPTMVIGVDISHAAPGGVTASVAAMTMSVDRDATKYAAMVETNGYRVEILSPNNVTSMFGNLSKIWMAGHERAFPKHIIYFRDGVAEGQFAHVLENEIAGIRKHLHTVAPNMPAPKFTVIVATKRHHIRFFPQKGDKNNNPLPGTLVEKEVTHPFMFDFYLCSHVAIQGTARPVHYHVILDEMGIPVNELQKMIYHQCYSYARSTTPVSLHPAVYYAHLAGSRARSHENIATSEGFRVGAKGHEMTRDRIAKGQSVGAQPKGSDAPPLLQLGGRPEGDTPLEGEMRQREFFRSTMWYI